LDDVVFPALTPVGDHYRIFFADIDGDGDDDFCFMNMQTGDFEAYRNTGAAFEGTAYIQQSTGLVSYPFNGSEPLLADLTADGKADLVLLDQINMQFSGYENTGTGFDPTAKLFKGLQERFEHQYFLNDFDADGIADVLQYYMRSGDVIVHKTHQTDVGGYTLSSDGIFRCIGAPKFPYASEGRKIPNFENHSVNGMMFYEVDYDESFQRSANGGWYLLNPNEPGIAPDDGQIYQTDQSLLGWYNSRDPEVIKQHAYWMRSMGIDVVLLDWTNLTSTKQPASHLYEFTLRVHDATRAILDVYSTITEFVPPKVAVSIRMQEEFAPFTITQEISDDVWDICSRYPDLCFQTHDGSGDYNKPILVAFSGFSDPAWTSTGPVWGDGRFNMRYMNGYLMYRPGMAVTESPEWGRFANDRPYWPFVENDPTGGGYYRNLYRRLPGTDVSEIAISWAGLYTANPTIYDWDGQRDLVGGKYLLERYTQPLYGKAPRITFMNRWCYPAGWYDQPQEGLSQNYSVTIEPTVAVGFDAYNRAANVMYDLRSLVKQLPAKPIIISLTDEKYVAYVSGNFPVQYKVSDDEQGIGESWQYIDANNPVIELPVSLQGEPFYLRTKNSFGESASTYQGYEESGFFFGISW
jgi:hypothetical protein